MSATYTVVIRDEDAMRPVIFRGKSESIRARVNAYFAGRAMLPWTDKREQFVREHYRRVSAAKIAAVLTAESRKPFTRSAVISRARKLGLGKGGAV